MRACALAVVLLLLGPCAVFPDEGADWWSLRPLSRAVPPLPRKVSPPWGYNAIDAFVLARLEDKGLSPSPEADRRTLIRRLTFDLLGLPPTPDEVEAFVADPRPDAYERLADRLLASPHHGERAARFWMDLVHYAETHGHDQDRIRPNAWPYRDYLIRSFNSDKPYGRFVAEQVAGDVLFPDSPEAIPALGFLATGPWDESSLRDIRDDTLDRQVARVIDRDDIVTTVLATFTSTTVHCARCHDHKFDPISQGDYYSLQAVFAATDKADRPYDPDPALAARRRALKDTLARLEKRPPEDPAWRTPEAQKAVSAWETRFRGRQILWHPLRPQTAKSEGGATLTLLPDGSALSGGKRPEKDTTTFTFTTDLKSVKGIRLDVLTDDSLPHKGPGRQENGNLHLNEIEVRVASKGSSSEPKRLALRHPSADFNQDGWGVARAIDGDLATAWGIYPRVGQAHQAIFEFADPIHLDESSTLTVVLRQTHGGGHLIGRARFSLTTATPPLSATAEVLPEAVASAMALAESQRTPSQKATLARHVLVEHARRELASLPEPSYVYAGASDFKPDGSFKPAGKPRPVHVLKRGEVTRPGAMSQPGALSFITEIPSRFSLTNPEDEGSRRAALAHWLIEARHPLTWRSIANRIWAQHFGRGLVDTPSDFGRMGSLPTHPELLDVLAVYLKDNGNSLKSLRRWIVTSATYRQAARHDPEAARLDADNRLLWTRSRLRLDADQLRDAVLATSGRLDRRMEGPSARQFLLSPGIHVTPQVDYLGFEVDRPEMARRSVYRFLFRTLPDPYFEALDSPDASQWTPVRQTSLSALQALALRNDRFMVRMSEHCARDLAQKTSGLEHQISELFRRTMSREATPEERTTLVLYARRFGMANLVRLLWNTNEFVFVN